jgi:hypothetical protein
VQAGRLAHAAEEPVQGLKFKLLKHYNYNLISKHMQFITKHLFTLITR